MSLTIALEQDNPKELNNSNSSSDRSSEVNPNEAETHTPSSEPGSSTCSVSDTMVKTPTQIESKSRSLESIISELTLSVSKLRAENEHCRSRLVGAVRRATQLATQLDNIENASDYRAMRSLEQRMNIYLPNGTRRAKLREIVGRNLIVAANEGVGSLIRQTIKKKASQELTLLENSVENNLQDAPMKQSLYSANQPKTPIKSILLISHNLNLEGAPLALFNIGKALRDLSFAVTVISPLDGKLRDRYVQSGVSVHVIPALRRLCQRANEELRGLISSYDLIFVNTIVMFFIIFLTSAPDYPLGQRVVWLIRESPDIQEFCREMVVGRAKLANCAALVDRVVFLCEATRNLYAEFDINGNFQVIHDGVEANGPPQSSSNLVRSIAPQNFNVVTVGTICPNKGQDILIRAAEILIAKHHDFKFHIIGKVGDLKFYKELKDFVSVHGLSHSVNFTGELDQDKIRDYLAQCQAFVLPSWRESFPLSVLEAMAAGKPIVATGRFGIAEQLQHLHSGLLIQPGDTSGLVASLLQIHDDSRFARMLGENARQNFSTRFTLDDMINQYKRLIAELLPDTTDFLGEPRLISKDT